MPVTPKEALEVVVASGPALASKLGPVVAAFGRVSGLGVRRARVLAREVVSVVSRACRSRARVRVTMDAGSRRLKVLVRFARRARVALGKLRTAPSLPGLRVERAGRGVLVLSLGKRFRDRGRAAQRVKP